jgi:hypothetical protein
MRLVGIHSETAFFVLLILREITVKIDDFGITFKGENVGRNTI